VTNKHVRLDEMCEVRDSVDIKKPLGDLALGDSTRCNSPERDSILVADVGLIACPWDSGMGQAEAARKALWLEIEVTCERNGSGETMNGVRFWSPPVPLMLRTASRLLRIIAP
jgi:hypothetical protein